jgi:hypothetical protein
MTDGTFSRESLQNILSEDLRDQSHLAVMMELSIVRGDDPSTLLTTMLKGIETEIGEIGRFKMIINPKDTAHGFSP